MKKIIMTKISMIRADLHGLKYVYKTTVLLSLLFSCFIISTTAHAASLALSPSTGVYTANGIFTVNVLVNTNGKPVNAADGVLSFDTSKMSVVSVNRSGSIFNLWVTEPTFSNSAGTVNFSGGLPSGYTGKSGKIMSVTFRLAGAGTAKASFSSGSVLANDGRGTNILTSMGSGAYTIQAAAITPVPELIEYIAPPNTPGLPKITSSTHSDPAG